MKNQFRRVQMENIMKALAMLLLLVSPFIGYAQADDIYFVPKKESGKKTLVVESVSDKYGITSAAKISMRDVDEYNRRSGGYTNDPEAYIEENYSDEYYDDEYQEYDYSTRIVRFHSPRRAFGSIYWDLSYGCGINDWYVYDNGYSIDIYPTVNNPLYFWGDFSFAWNSLNYYNWRSWYNYYGWGYSPYWGWHYPGYHHHYYDHYWYGHNWCGPHWNGHVHADRWYDGRRPNRRIPVNGAVTAKRDNIPSNSSVRGGNNRGTVAGKGNNGGVDLRGVRKDNGRGDASAVGQRNEGQSKNDRNGVNLRGSNRNGNGQVREIRFGSGNEGNRKVGENGARRQQPARSMVNAEGNKRNSSAAGSSNGNVRQSRNDGGSKREQSGTVNRRGSSSTGSYNRQSSTNVTRSRSGSTQSRSSSSYSSGSSSRSRSNSSSYSSGSSSRSRSNSSSYSSGSSSRSNSSGFGGGSSSRGSSGGGSRGSGGGRGR
ncbi:MAG: hypothetical protein E7093_01435 [Bacteroidales bacterium]|nr:hypothetical protein [Bacteroidales bacterium]